MDETQLVSIGYIDRSNDLKIAVLDYGPIQPFCHIDQQKPSNVLSGYSSWVVLNNSSLNNTIIPKTISYFRFVLNGLKLIGSRNYYNFCIVPVSLLTCAFFLSRS